jgi:hypothetical protein
VIIKDCQIQFVIDQVCEGIFEAARQYLAIKGDGDHLHLIKVVILIAGHHPFSLPLLLCLLFYPKMGFFDSLNAHINRASLRASGDRRERI